MTKYREIIRLHSLNFIEQNIALSCSVSRNTVSNQQDEQTRRATMHIPRKPGEQVEVDWAGDSAYIIDPDTGEITEARLFVGVMTYSMCAYVEAFINEKQKVWITAHVHMYEYFGEVLSFLQNS